MLVRWESNKTNQNTCILHLKWSDIPKCAGRGDYMQNLEWEAPEVGRVMLRIGGEPAF
jgi:hypothetical protein